MYIMNPAMIISWIFGVLLIHTTGVENFGFLWLQWKLIFVIILTIYHFFLFRSYSSAAKFTRWLPSDFYQGFKQINSLTLILLGCSKHFGCIESFRQRGVQLAPHDLDAG